MVEIRILNRILIRIYLQSSKRKLYIFFELIKDIEKIKVRGELAVTNWFGNL